MVGQINSVDRQVYWSTGFYHTSSSVQMFLSFSRVIILILLYRVHLQINLNDILSYRASNISEPRISNSTAREEVRHSVCGEGGAWWDSCNETSL